MVGGAAADVEMPDAAAGTAPPSTLLRGDSETMLRVEDHGVVAVATTDAAALKCMSREAPRPPLTPRFEPAAAQTPWLELTAARTHRRSNPALRHSNLMWLEHHPLSAVPLNP